MCDDLSIGWFLFIKLYNKVSNHKSKVDIDFGGYSPKCLKKVAKTSISLNSGKSLGLNNDLVSQNGINAAVQSYNDRLEQIEIGGS